MEPQSKQYICTNSGECDKADKKETIEITPGDDAICPECKKDNTLKPVEVKKRFSVWVYPVVIALALIICGGIYLVYSKYSGPSDGPKTTTTITTTPATTSILQKKPESSETLVKEGIAFVKESKYEDAEKAFRKAVELEPENADALGNLGAVYSVMGKKDDALKYTRMANEKNPKNPNWWMNLAEIYCTQKDRDNAIKAFENAVKNGFKNKNALKDMNLQLIENDPSYKRIVGDM